MSKVDDESTWPTYSNDDGTGQSGTPLDEDFLDAILDSINAVVHSASNPTVSVANCIDEIVTARGSEASLDARLDVSLNNDGTLITPADVITESKLQSTLGAVNLLANEDFLLWSALGTPDYWGVVGPLTLVRAGTGEADTTRKVGPYCLKLTHISGTPYIWQSVIDQGLHPAMDNLEGQKIAVGCWIKSSGGGAHAKMYIYDGATATSLYSAGAGSWEWVSGTHEISSSANRIWMGLQIMSAGDAYFSGPTVIFSDYAPSRWIPSPRELVTIPLSFTGALATGDNQGSHIFERSALLIDVQACPGTPHDGTAVAPAAGPITIDVEKLETGASWVSVFSGAKDIVADGAFFGSTQPDGDYDHRCFHGYSGASVDNTVIRLNLDAVNGAESFNFLLRFVQYARALEGLYAYNDHGGAT